MSEGGRRCLLLCMGPAGALLGVPGMQLCVSVAVCQFAVASW